MSTSSQIIIIIIILVVKFLLVWYVHETKNLERVKKENTYLVTWFYLPARMKCASHSSPIFHLISLILVAFAWLELHSHILYK